MAGASIAVDPNSRPTCFRNIFEELIFVFTVTMATSSTTFIQGVIVINTATIGNSLKMTSAQVTWIAAAIGLASGSFMLFFGKTADLFGGKAQLLGGMAFLSLISLIASFVESPIALNVLCGFLGLGTAIISPPAIGTLFATYPEGRRRNKATGALGAGNPIGFIFGSISSGMATKIFNWRAAFIVVAIFFFIMSLLAFWTVPRIPASGNIKTEVKQFDWMGSILIVLGMSLFCAALTEGPVRGWKSLSVLIMVILGIFLLIGFAIWENVYKTPLLNPAVWKNRNYTLCVLSVFFGYMSFITNQFWISLYMQEVQKLAPLMIAVRLLPQAITGIIWSFVGQALVSRLSGTIIMGIGAVAYLLGAILQIFIRENTSYWKFLFPSLLITVLGADFQFIISNLYVATQMPAQASLAAGVLQTAMRLSVSLGLSITAAVYGSSVAAPEAKDNQTFAFDRAYLCTVVFAAVGLLFVPFMRIGIQGTPSPVADPEKTTAPTHAPNIEREGNSPPHLPISTTDTVLLSSVSNYSMFSQATDILYANEHSYFPSWGWEEEEDGFARDESVMSFMEHVVIDAQDGDGDGDENVDGAGFKNTLEQRGGDNNGSETACGSDAGDTSGNGALGETGVVEREFLKGRTFSIEQVESEVKT